MEIPSTDDGSIIEILVNVGDKVSTGDVIAKLSAATDSSSDSKAAPDSDASDTTSEAAAPASAAQQQSSTHQVVVPEIGDFDAIEVIEVLVSVGDTVDVDQSLITLESDKASMEIPSTAAGTVTSIATTVGGKMSQGDLVAEITVTASARSSAPKAEATTAAPPAASAAQPATPAPASNKPQPKSSPTQKIADESYRRAHASPAVRKLSLIHI